MMVLTFCVPSFYIQLRNLCTRVVTLKTAYQSLAAARLLKFTSGQNETL